MRRQHQTTKSFSKACGMFCLAAITSLGMIASSKEAALAGSPSTSHHHSIYEGGRVLLAKHDRHSHSKTRQSAAENQEGSGSSEAGASEGSQGSSDSSYSESSSGDSSGAGEASTNSTEGGTASGEQPHTLLYYVATTIGMIVGVTILLAMISSSSVVFLATIWHFLKMINGGKKPSIG